MIKWICDGIPIKRSIYLSKVLIHLLFNVNWNLCLRKGSTASTVWIAAFNCEEILVLYIETLGVWLRLTYHVQFLIRNLLSFPSFPLFTPNNRTLGALLAELLKMKFNSDFFRLSLSRLNTYKLRYFCIGWKELVSMWASTN